MLAVQMAIRQAADPAKAAFFPRFFKAGTGEYAEGDRFLGVTVPRARAIAKMFRALPEKDLSALLASKWHEERLVALLILVGQYRKGDAKEKASVVRFYLSQLDRVNNWDLVDLSSYAILGESLVDGSRAVLHRLARSKDLWRRRVAMVSTFAFIRRGECAETFRVADILLEDEHDLIHKATGWMLREAGKRCGKGQLVAYLKPRYKTMPRTMLRYAIEKFPEGERKRYLAGKV